jgi:hypothetical protein
MSLGTNLPFHDRTGMLEHSRDFSHLTLSERERIAFAAGDRFARNAPSLSPTAACFKPPSVSANPCSPMRDFPRIFT